MDIVLTDKEREALVRSLVPCRNAVYDSSEYKFACCLGLTSESLGDYGECDKDCGHYEPVPYHVCEKLDNGYGKPLVVHEGMDFNFKVRWVLANLCDEYGRSFINFCPGCGKELQ